MTVADAAAAEFDLPISCSIPIQPCLVDTSAYPHLSFGFCAAGTDRAYYTLDPLGNLRPCNHTTTVLGNLLEEPFADLIAPGRIAAFCESEVRSIAHCSGAERILSGNKKPLLFEGAFILRTYPKTSWPGSQAPGSSARDSSSRLE